MKKKPRTPPAKAPEKKKYSMCLYITGATARSSRALANLRRLCDTYLSGQYELSVVDVFQQPELARKVQIIAAPTLVKALPLPLRRFIGDLSNTENLLSALEVHQTPSVPALRSPPERDHEG